MSPETPRPCGQSRHVPLASGSDFHGVVELYDSHLGKCTNTYIMHSFWFLGIRWNKISRFQQINLTEIPKRSRWLSPFWPSLEAILLTILPTLQLSRYSKWCFFHCHVSFLEGNSIRSIFVAQKINSLDPGRSSQSSLQSQSGRREGPAACRRR